MTIDTGVVVLAVGASVNSLVNLAKMAGMASTPARTIGVALVAAAALVALYAFAPVWFALAAAAVLATAGAVGIHEMGQQN
jgi:hypothetical protein